MTKIKKERQAIWLTVPFSVFAAAEGEDSSATSRSWSSTLRLSRSYSLRHDFALAVSSGELSEP